MASIPTGPPRTNAIRPRTGEVVPKCLNCEKNVSKMIQDIAKAVYLFRAFPNLDDYSIYKRLIAEGVESHRAARLVEFLPIVYCRSMLRNSGVRFSTTFRRSAAGGGFEEQMFSSQPVWNAAVTFVDNEARQGVSAQDILAIAARSSEFDAANQLLNGGTKLRGVTFSSPVLLWSDKGPPSLGNERSE